MRLGLVLVLLLPFLACGATAKAPARSHATATAVAADCEKPAGVQRLAFSAAKYPNIQAHMERAFERGWPVVMVLNRSGADKRRDKLLQGIPTKPGYDRDEYPAAVGRGFGGPGLSRGSNPRGWKADVEYVPSGENRSHGASLGAKLRGLCRGTKFRYVFK